MVRYLVVKTSKKNGHKSLCDNGAVYANKLTAIRHLHLNEAKKSAYAQLFDYEVMAIPDSMLITQSMKYRWIRDIEETREEILKDYLENA